MVKSWRELSWDRVRTKLVLAEMPLRLEYRLADSLNLLLHVFTCQIVCIINDYSYLCRTRTRQASQRCSNVRVVFVKSNEHNRILFGFCHDEKTKNEVHGFPKVFFKALYHHRILTELKQISCEATPIRIHGTHGEHGF